MVLLNTKDKKEYTVTPKKHAGEEAMQCPMCSDSRKKKTDKCFSFNHDKNVGRCNHCGESLVLKTERLIKEYKKPPPWENRTKLSDNVVKWFLKRGINQETLIHFKISEGKEFMPQVNKEINTIQYPYLVGGEVVNIKYRGPKKEFKMFKDAQLVPFNIDSLAGATQCVIVEGQDDCMAVHQAGIHHVISVPSGATLGKCNLEYIDDFWHIFSEMTRIFLATDDDPTGLNLQEQLADKFGKNRCVKVRFDGCKDANECLQKFGAGGIISALEGAKPYPLEGIHTIIDYEDEIDDIYRHGLPDGAKTMMPSLNNLITFHKGYFTVITGIPNQGKSSVLDQITLQLAIKNDWKGAFYSPESKPTSLHISNMARKITGKRWRGDDNVISPEEIMSVKEYLNDRFFFVNPEEDYSLSSILRYIRALNDRKGIDFFVIDAWNKLEHKYQGNDENRHIGSSLDEIAVFCDRHKLHLFMVAHPRKMTKDKNDKFIVPNAYDINGSANWYNKPDVVLTVYRDYDSIPSGGDETKIYVQKVKFDHWGRQGFVSTVYDPMSGRFTEYSGGAIINHDRSPWIGTPKPEIFNEGPPF